jgi:hypothetical protein
MGLAELGLSALTPNIAAGRGVQVKKRTGQHDRAALRAARTFMLALHVPV